MTTLFSSSARHKATWDLKILMFVTALAAVGVAPHASAAPAGSRQSRHATPGRAIRSGVPGRNVRVYKVDEELSRRERADANGRTKVIVTLRPGAALPDTFKRFVRRQRQLDLINGQELELPNRVLRQLEAHPDVFQVHHDRPVTASNYRTGITIGADVVRQSLGYTGAGVGVAVIDSGVSAWHNDLTKGSSSKTYPYGNQRVAKFVDFVNGVTQPYDDNGHGSHVAGIIAGNGYESKGEKSGVAPGASLVVLKVLDANGNGTIGDVIAAMSWILRYGAAYNIRVVNLSIGARVNESYWSDPLTLAAKKLTDRGITVVTAAGNFGKGTDGRQQYGAITAPGNAPWVLTVGASSTQGTTTRLDDDLAAYSSAGPTQFDYLAKPDLVAPGTGTASLAVPGSVLFAAKPSALLNGTSTPNAYLSLSGTSMAAPVVAGTVAVMLQANPSLTPNLIKAILQYTAQTYAGYRPLQQGAGFLNALGAVRLARFYHQNIVGSRMPVQASWSRTMIWGNRLIKGGYPSPRANAWRNEVVWGVEQTSIGDNVVWGTLSDRDNVVWGTGDVNGDNIVWGTSLDDNVVWGTTILDNVVWGTGGFDDNVVWGTSGLDDNVVWGTDCGGGDCDHVVWGTTDLDNVVWGTGGFDDNVVWGTSGFDDNVVWGTFGDDNVVWGTSDGATPDVVFPDSANEPRPDIERELDRPSADLFTMVGGL